jgi:RNA polymerase sigma-70 factor (ECF subfamily)
VAHPEDDETLLPRLAAGDRAALDRLYDRYAGPTYALLLRIVADRQLAEDLLQEVFLRVWQRAGSYRIERGRALTWVLGIAHNLAIDELRRQRRRPRGAEEREGASATDFLAAVPATEPGPEQVVWEQHRRAQIAGALGQLPEAQRVLIELAYFEGYTQSQLAARFGEPLGTIKTRLRLGVQKLRGILGEHGLDAAGD